MLIWHFPFDLNDDQQRAKQECKRAAVQVRRHYVAENARPLLEGA
jgi:hypothetical protein